MRLTRGRCSPALVLLVLLCTSPAHPQDTQILMPEQSAAKARQLLQQAIDALGGPAYLRVTDQSCVGRYGLFGHSGDLTGYDTFYEESKYPDKDRIEYSKKRNIIDVFNDDHGWTLDRGGVTEKSADAIAQQKKSQAVDIDEVLRHRLNEPGMILRYAGPDVVDLHQAEWVELTDNQGRQIRFAFDHSTHLPLREVVVERDETTRLRTEEITIFSNWHPIEGVQTPYQITRQRNGLKVFQVFLEECKYNTGISDDLFTEASLNQRWQKVGKKQKKKSKD